MVNPNPSDCASTLQDLSWRNGSCHLDLLLMKFGRESGSRYLDCGFTRRRETNQTNSSADGNPRFEKHDRVTPALRRHANPPNRLALPRWGLDCKTRYPPPPLPVSTFSHATATTSTTVGRLRETARTAEGPE
ncbi:protein Wnt-11b-2-like X1 [Biomphalaria pfeifferi]|uniref:Protein Wnt-11b-2-like X1 n=1 Tax=Biomphalaria pfeifferi TaxID=112525 RepID=A0AAD8BUH9_BIOPF|nr:protein Wnt-11b-2-like X1 [Biomphalaria pfeifferi]